MERDDEFLGDEYDMVRVENAPRELECCMLGARYCFIFRRRLESTFSTQLFQRALFLPRPTTASQCRRRVRAACARQHAGQVPGLAPAGRRAGALEARRKIRFFRRRSSDAPVARTRVRRRVTRATRDSLVRVIAGIIGCSAIDGVCCFQLAMSSRRGHFISLVAAV